MGRGSGFGKLGSGSSQILGIPATLVVFAGQSNAKGWSTDPGNTSTLTNGNAYEFYPSGSSGVLLPLGNNLMGRTQGGPQRPFAEYWANHGGGTVIIVDAAVNGASLVDAGKTAQSSSGVDLGGGTWDLASGLSHYTNWATPLINSARTVVAAQGFRIAKTVVVWAQGETDGNAAGLVDPAIYATNLESLIDRFVTDFSINAFLISELGTPGAPGDNTYWDAIRTAQHTAQAARSSVATMAFTGASAFYAASKMVDTLHYTQVGYNEMGLGLATNGLTFLGGLSLTAPLAAKFTTIATAFPAISGFKRAIITTTRNGAFGPQIYSDPATPFASTWIDETGANPSTADQALTWTFGSAASKRVCIYISDTVGGSLSLVGGGSISVTKFEFPDAGLKINTLNMGSGADLAATCTIAEADFLNLDASTLAFVGLPGPSAVVATNNVISRYTNVTSYYLDQSATGVLDLTLDTNLTTVSMTKIGLSTANINTMLQALDANGKTGGSCNFSQFQSSPPIAGAPPSGAGATAKTNLVGKGWTVTTD